MIYHDKAMTFRNSKTGIRIIGKRANVYVDRHQLNALMEIVALQIDLNAQREEQVADEMDAAAELPAKYTSDDYLMDDVG